MYDFVTTADLITNKAPATQECYGSSWKAARIADTFAITYPETLVKKLEKKDTASHGGYIFTPDFGFTVTFEGTVEHSTKDAMKNQLADNMDIHQSAFDTASPPQST